jgi:prepilin signal peptidase PulO-like enzyme (type II secretory pathway)
MSLRRMRSGELVALAGAVCLIVALTLPWYENAQGKLGAWATFGPAVALLVLAAGGAVALALATVTERTTAIPVAAAVWSTLFGILASVAAIVRLLERPEHATELCAGAWLALIGALAVLVGSWQSLRDERTGMYPPDTSTPREAPR